MPHAVPVVEHIDARTVSGQQHRNHLPLVIGGGKRQEIRVGRTGGVPFLAVQAIAVSDPAQPRQDGAQRRADLGMGPGKQLTVEDFAEVVALFGAVRAVDHRFSEVEMRAQRVGHIRVRACQSGDQFDVVTDAAARPAQFLRHAQGAETGLAYQAKGFERQLTFQITLRRLLRNLFHQRWNTPQQSA
ncbi:hypothetical protein D3C86_1642960 [compost metagenome]